jgi:hypothetical protein
MVGCDECDAKSYEEARVKCPLINSDKAKEELLDNEGVKYEQK